MDSDSDSGEGTSVVPRVNRFKHQSYKKSLKEVHLPSALDLTKFDHDISDNESHFYLALQQWRQLNLSPAFVQFANKVDSLSISMPILLHNWKEIVDLWKGALDASDHEALKALLDLLNKLAHDLRTTLAPSYADLLEVLLRLLPQPIPAPSLTALLATLSGLFRYLLVPSINLDLLDQTWSSFRAVLPSCNSDVQRAAAEVWGSVLRRLKSVARERAVILMAKNLEGVEDASAWMMIFACKSVSQTLHTSAGSSMACLIDCHLTSDRPELSYRLLRRVLTALIHHCNGSEHFSVIASLIVDRFCAVSQAEGVNHQHLQRAMQITSVLCAVRTGSRLSSSHLTQLASSLASLPCDVPLHSELLIFAASLLTAGDMSMSAGTGRAFVARALSVPSFGLMLCGVLAELGWGGWKLVGLPALLKATPSLLQAEPSLTLRLLASLQQSGKLGEVDIVWKRSVDTWIQNRLSSWEISDDSVDDLYNIMSLSVFVDSLAPSLVPIIERSLNTSTPEANWQTSHANAAWVIGTCMQALSRCKSASWETQVDLSAWTTEIVEHWSWSDKVLMGLVALLETCPSTSQSLPIAQLYSRLQSRLLSPSRSLRSNVLGLLTSKMVKSSPAEHEALKRCLQGDEVSLDMHGVRERVLRIGRLYQVVRDDDSLSADICVRWLVSQLKVNLRPIWSPASEALSSLAQKFGDIVWNIVFSELQQPQGANETPDWLTATKDDENDMDPWEEERSWRDPTAHRLRGAAVNWLDKHYHRKIIISEQKPSDRFDPVTFETQLLLTLGQCTSLAEKHNRELVTYFLSIAGPDAPSRLPKYKLQAWLTLFSKFSNPKALHSTDTLRELYRSHLSYPDRELQTVSLSCLLAYKSPHLQHHEEKLRLLLDETKWRDELTSLHMSSIEIKDRPQVVDVIIRLLYGLTLEKKGRSKSGDRRAAVLTALAGCTDEELYLLVDLMLKPMQSDSHARQDDLFSLRVISSDVPLKQQSGYLNLLGDVLKNLGSRLTTYWPALLGTTLDLVANAQKHLSDVTTGDVVEQVDNEADEEESECGEVFNSRVLRSLRQQGLKRLADFFRCPVDFDFTSYLSASFPAIVAPRLKLLDQENTQAPSALLELFFVWTSQAEYSVHLVQHDSRVLPKVLDCLVATNVKPAVISRVFDIVERLLSYSADDSKFLDLLVQPHISQLLKNLTTLVGRTKADTALSSPITQRQISILSEVARYAGDSTQALTLLGLLSPLLRKSSRIISEKVKVKLLSTLGHIFPLLTELSNTSSVEFSKAYELLSQLFMSLRFTASRLALTSAFNQLSVINPSIQELASLLESLNACSSKRIDQPDFNRRLTAFMLINEQKYAMLSCREWLPVLSNALYFVQDADELAIRNNAAFTIRRFIDLTCDPSNLEFEALLMRTALPALKNALKSKNELIRAEALGVISYAVSKCDRISSLQEMCPLLAGGDEEASFFSNIHHIQIHRRTRALRRLAEYCDEGAMRSRTLVEVFLPLVEHYVVPTASLDHLLVSEAINTTGRIAKYLGWSAYSALVYKYIRSSKEKTEGVRVYVRALVAILENFHFSVEEAVQHVDTSADDIANSDHEGLVDESLPVPSADTQDKKIADAVHTRLLPSLLAYLSNRDETEDALRIPISMGIAKVALHLPSASRDLQVGRLLTALSQILRSKSQDTRDLVRDTICRIAVALGSPYLPILLRELRAALLRGPQLHVLAFVFHAVLTHVTAAQDSNGPVIQDLDHCVADIAHVSAEVIFGESGKDVQHEDFRTKMREVRSSSSKGLDCFGLTARHVSPKRISALLLPLRSIIAETGSLKTLQQVDEVLRRIASGLNSNARLTPAELLVVCHTLISQNAKFLQEAPKPKATKSSKKADAIVQRQRQIVTDTDHYTNNSFRFVVFGLELFNTAFRRSRFDFKDKQIISRLDPLVKLIGNALYSSSEPVLIASFKASASILQCPLKSVSSSAPVIARQILAVVRSTGSGESEVAQAGLKALASILRECEAAQVKEKDLLFLIEFVSPYLEDPDRQGTVFALLRAIVARRLIVPELYDVMADVSAILVTSQAAQTRESARSLLLQFLLDYPQGSGRLQTTLGFFARNLSYEHASGRSSVLELLGALVNKFDSVLLAKHAEMIFVALVLCLANDEDKSCREASASVLQSLVKRLGEGERKVFVGHLHAWASQEGQGKLRAVAVQVYGLIIDALQREASPHAAALFADVQQILDDSIRTLTLSDGDGEDMDVDVEWQPPYQAMLAVSKLLQTLPEHTLDAVKSTQDKLVPYLLFPHAWVRSAACRLLGVFFAFYGPTPTLESSHLTLQLMKDIAEKLCSQLKSPHLDVPLGLQIVKNLFFVGKLFCTIPSSSPSGSNTNNTTEGAEGDSDGGESDDSAEQPTRVSRGKRSQDPLPWLFSKLSYQARSCHIARRNRGNTSNQPTWSLAPLSILRFFAAMASHMEGSQLERFLPHILTPVYRITEDDTIRDAGMEELKVTATELLDLLQNKVGTTTFANTYNRIRQGASNIQQERRVARATKATTNPEATAKRKLARNVGKKESRKRKNRAFADSRGRLKRQKEGE